MRRFESHPGLRVYLCGVLGCLSSFITISATICQTVSSWRVRGLSHLSSEQLHIHSTCDLYLVAEGSIFPNPHCWSSPPPSAAQPIDPGLAVSCHCILPLKAHPGAGYWSGSCPVDLIPSLLSRSEMRMSFAHCFSLLHDWVCATDDTWHCPFPA